MRSGPSLPLRLAVVVIAAAAAACSEPEHVNPFDPKTPAAAQATASLAGTVSLEQAGATPPVRSGVAVSVVGTAGSHVAVTDDAGAWTVSGVRPGSYTVTATKDPWVAGAVTGVTIALDDGDRTVTLPALSLRVARGAVAGTAVLRLPRSLVEASSAGVTVSVDGVPGAVQTDTAGAFVLSGVPAGLHALVLTKAGYHDGSLAAVTVTADGTVTTASIPLDTNPGWVEGVVTVVGASSAAGVVVRARGSTLAGTPWEDTTITPASGAYMISGLPAGTYALTWELTDHGTVSGAASVAPGVGTAIGPAALVRDTGAAAGVALLGGASDASGILVTLTPAPTGAAPAPTPAATVLTDAAGAWRADGLPVGAYALRYRKAPGYVEASGAVTVVAHAAVIADPVTLAALPATVRGQVAFEGGAAGVLGGTTVRVVGTTLSTVTLAAGTFTIPGIAAGSYRVAVERPGFDAVEVQVALAPADDLTLSPVTLAVSRGGVTGTVALDLSTAPGFTVADAAGTSVVLLDGTSQLGATVTDAAGGYAFTGVPAVAASGGFSVRAQRPGFTGLPRAVTPVAGTTVANQDLTLTLRTGRISGAVSLFDDAGGLGVPNASSGGATVTLSGTAFTGARFAPPAATSGTPGGAWAFPALPPGAYDLVVASAGRTCAAVATVTLDAGGDESVGTVECRDAVAPGYVGLGAPLAPANGLSGWTALISVDVPVEAQASDDTLPVSNLKGYQWFVGAAPDWDLAEAWGQVEPAWLVPPALITAGPLAADQSNTIWVRAVDFVGNAGPAVSVQVVQDPTTLAPPAMSTPRSIVSDTVASVTLTGPDADAGFLRYEACWHDVAATGACTVAACTPSAISQTFPLPLASNRLTCVWARTVGRNGQRSGLAGLAVLSDLEAPTTPGISPGYDTARLTIRADTVDFALTSPPTDAPAGGGAPWKGIAWLEVDVGAGFHPLCPATACRAGGTWAPCSAACSCDDPVLVCDPDTERLRALRFPVRAGVTSRFAVRAVDLGGNTGSAAYQEVVSSATEAFVAVGASDEFLPSLRGTVVTWFDWLSGAAAIDLGSDLRRDASDGEACFFGYSVSAAAPASQLLVALVDGNDVKVRRRASWSGFCPGSVPDATLRTAAGGDWVRNLVASGERVAWTENAYGSATNDRVWLREADAGGTLGEGAADPAPILIATIAGPAVSQGSVQLAGRYLLMGGSASGWSLAIAEPAGFAAGFEVVALPWEGQAAAISQDGQTLAFGVQVGRTASLTVIQAGRDRLLLTGDDVEAQRSYQLPALPDPWRWSLAADRAHVVALDTASTHQVTDWFSGVDGVFQDEGAPGSDDTVVRMLPSSTPRRYASMSGGVVAFQNGMTGADILLVDLTQQRWLAAGGTSYALPTTNGSGTVLFTDVPGYWMGARFFARYPDGTTSEGAFLPSGENQDFAAWGEDLVGNDRTHVTVQPASGGRWFGAGPAPDPTVVFTAAAQYGIDVFAGGDGKLIVSDDSSGVHEPYVLQADDGLLSHARPVALLPAPGVVPMSGIYGAAVAVTERYAFFSCEPAIGFGNRHLCLRDAGNDLTFDATDAGSTVLLRRMPAMMPVESVMDAKASGRRVAIRESSMIRVIDAGPNGLFNDGADDSERVLSLGYAGPDSFAIAGDWLAYLDSGAPAGLQVYLLHLPSGAVRQLTSHYSTKGGLVVEPTGRVLWRDDLFSASAIFERTP